MTHPAPKFAVGQRVMIVAPAAPEYRSTDALICSQKYAVDQKLRSVSGGFSFYTGWLYELDVVAGKSAREDILRPRPKPAADSWDALKQTLVIPNPYAEAGGLVTTDESSWDAESARRIFDELTAKSLNFRGDWVFSYGKCDNGGSGL